MLITFLTLPRLDGGGGTGSRVRSGSFGPGYSSRMLGCLSLFTELPRFLGGSGGRVRSGSFGPGYSFFMSGSVWLLRTFLGFNWEGGTGSRVRCGGLGPGYSSAIVGSRSGLLRISRTTERGRGAGSGVRVRTGSLPGYGPDVVDTFTLAWTLTGCCVVRAGIGIRDRTGWIWETSVGCLGEDRRVEGQGSVIDSIDKMR